MLHDFLKETFHFDTFRLGQKEILTALLEQKDCVGILPTGTGKSLIYQYYGLKQHCRVIIVSPLLSLMYDQVHELQLLDVKSTVALTSFLSKEEKKWIMQRLHEFQFLFLSPEMLQQKALLERLRQLEIGLLVIDEAHCISQWGKDFRPEYKMLGEIRKILEYPLTLALSATANQAMIKDIKESLYLSDDYYLFRSLGVKKSNFIEIMPLNGWSRSELFVQVMNKINFPCVVYASSIQQIEELKAEFVHLKKWNVDSYHSKRSREDRQAIQQQFKMGQIDILFATSAFGMGVNQKNIRTIIHYHLPNTIEDYVQQIGRAGRDGLSCQSIAFFEPNDVKRMKTFLKKEMEHVTFSSTLTKETEETHSMAQTFYQLAKFFGWDEGEFHQQFMSYCKEKYQKIDWIYQLATTSFCYKSIIHKYFEDDFTTRCESCSLCLGKSVLDLEDRPFKKIERIPQTWEEKFHQLFRLQ